MREGGTVRKKIDKFVSHITSTFPVKSSNKVKSNTVAQNISLCATNYLSR